MAVAQTLFALTAPAAASSGITAWRGVVMDGSTRGNVKLPASTPEITFYGVSDQNGVDVNGEGTYVLYGVAIIESDGSAVVNPGDSIVLVGTTGQGKSQAIAIPSAPGTQGNWTVRQIIGMCVNRAQLPATANVRIEVLLRVNIVPCA